MRSHRRSQRAALVAALVVVAASFGAVPAAAGSPPAEPPPDPPMRTRREVGGLSGPLAAIAARAGATPRAQAVAAGLPVDGPGSLIRDDAGRLIVDVTLIGGRAALDSLRAVGAEVIAADDAAILVTVAIPPSSLSDLAALPSVAYVVAVPAPVVGQSRDGGTEPHQDGAVTSAACGDRVISEGDTQLQAAGARSTYGVDGNGIRIGILSDSFDDLGGAATDVADGELPGAGNPCGRTTPVVVESDLGSGGSDEGRAMAQLVHDLAPGAELAFATAFTGELGMANNITQLGVNGADVITDDVYYFTEPMFQDGPIAAAIGQNRATRDIPHFTSAGNSNVIIGGRNVASYETPAFRAVPCPAVVTALDPGYNACHDFATGAGVDTGSGLTLAAGGSITLQLGWSEPMYGVGADLDVLLVDTVTNAIVAGSANVNASTNRANEFFSHTNPGGVQREFDVVIGRYGPGAPDPTGTPRFKHALLRAPGLAAVEYDTSRGGDVVGPTLLGHAASDPAVGVAAVRYSNASVAETFSSRGPAAICWETDDGSTPQDPITPCQVTTVDVAATDGAANSFFGSPAGGGVFRFFGTSAAAPHAAAVAGLASEYVCGPAVALEGAMFRSAADVGGFGGNVVGAGLVDALAMLAACRDPYTDAIADVVVEAGTSTGQIAFGVGDVDDGPGAVTLQVASSNPSVLPNSGSVLALGGSGANRTIRVDPPITSSGTATVTVTATDPGDNTSTTSFVVTVTPSDIDDDGVPDVSDNCPATKNAGQADVDGDGIGDACDPLNDNDGDGVRNSSDNCPGTKNAGQADVDGDGIGDACDPSDDRVVFTSLTPARFADSRNEPTFDDRFRNTGPRAGESVWKIDLAGRGLVGDDSSAVIVNLTVINGVAPGFATVYPCGPLPIASSVNYAPGTIEANEVVSKLSDDGALCIYALTQADVIVDVVGVAGPDSPYTALTPTRFADSRNEPTFDGAFRNTGPRAGGSTWKIDIAGRGGVPDGATAVVANLTVTNGVAPGFATVHPCGALPLTSSLNYDVGITRPNEVIAKLSPDGAICVYTLTQVDVIVDVVGFLDDADGFTPMTPARFADSRDEPTFDGGFSDTGIRPAGSTWEIQVAGRGGVPSDASTAVANVTVTGGQSLGFATVFPCGDLPTASSLNYDVGVTRPNEVVAKLSSRGTLCIYTFAPVEVIVDIAGYA